MHSLAQPGRSSLQRAGSSCEPARTRDPRRLGGCLQQKPPALSRTEIFTVTIVLYLRREAKKAPARRCRMIAGVAAGAAILPPSVLLTGCGASHGNPETGNATDSVLGPFAPRLPPLRLRPPKRGGDPFEAADHDDAGQ